jgi:hypothetical protein
MNYRKLRIGWSVAWGVLAVLLVADCVTRQYRRADIELIRRSGPGPTGVAIYRDKLALSWEPSAPYRPEWAGQINRYGFRYNMYSNGSWNVWGPLWLVSAVAASIAAVPWVRFRFGLRTLLIATTLVAAVLGLIVWAAK